MNAIVDRLRTSGLVHDPNNQSEPFAVDVTATSEAVARAFEGEELFEKALERSRDALESTVAMDDELEDLARLIVASN